MAAIDDQQVAYPVDAVCRVDDPAVFINDTESVFCVNFEAVLDAGPFESTTAA